MNIYYLVDDYDYSETGILVTDKSAEEVQEMVKKIKAKSDCLFDDMMYAFEANDIRFLSEAEIEAIIW